MKSHQRDFFIARILHGRLPVGNHYLGKPTWEDRLRAAQIYNETLEEGYLSGLFTLDEIQIVIRQPYNISDFKYKIRIWSDEQEDKLTILKDDIDKLKIGIFESQLNKGQQEAARVGLRKAEDEVEKLLHLKHSLDGMSAEGMAIMHRQIYLIGSSLYDSEGNKALTGDWYHNTHSPLLHLSLRKFTENIIEEQQYRELARNDPWRSIWSARKNDGLFGYPSTDLNDEQRSLVLWSQFYDNIYESPECPSDDIVDDNDALDGWVLLQKKRREKDHLANTIESKLSDKAKNADEIYIPADPEFAKQIDDLNSVEAKIRKRQRLNQVRQQGMVEEIQFNDNQQRLKEQLINMKKEREDG